MGDINPIAHHPRLPNSSPAAYMSLILSPGAVVVKNEPAIVDAGDAGVDLEVVDPL